MVERKIGLINQNNQIESSRLEKRRDSIRHQFEKNQNQHKKIKE